MKKTKSVRISEDLHKKVRVYSAGEGIPMSEVVEKACSEYLEKETKKAP